MSVFSACQQRMTVLKYPPYSPELAPWDFLMFLDFERHVNDHCYKNRTGFGSAIFQLLKVYLRGRGLYSNICKNCIKRLKLCTSEGRLFRWLEIENCKIFALLLNLLIIWHFTFTHPRSLAVKIVLYLWLYNIIENLNYFVWVRTKFILERQPTFIWYYRIVHLSYHWSPEDLQYEWSIIWSTIIVRLILKLLLCLSVYLLHSHLCLWPILTLKYRQIFC